MGERTGMQMKEYKRSTFEVEAVEYELGKGIEDGMMPYTAVITAGWINAENLIQVTQKDGTVVCPFIQNRRGRIFLREGDYFITEKDQERHVCGKDKFFERYHLVEE